MPKRQRSADVRSLVFVANFKRYSRNRFLTCPVRLLNRLFHYHHYEENFP